MPEHQIEKMKSMISKLIFYTEQNKKLPMEWMEISWESLQRVILVWKDWLQAEFNLKNVIEDRKRTLTAIYGGLYHDGTIDEGFDSDTRFELKNGIIKPLASFMKNYAVIRKWQVNPTLMADQISTRDFSNKMKDACVGRKLKFQDEFMWKICRRGCCRFLRQSMRGSERNRTSTWIYPKFKS